MRRRCRGSRRESHGRRGRNLRLPRAERRGEIHDHQHAVGFHAPERGNSGGSRTRRTERTASNPKSNRHPPGGYDLYDRLTAREHLEFAIDAKNADADPSELIDRVGLSQEDADRKVGGYSKGMAQRLVLASALVGDPDLLILDEPSSGLDPHGIREMRELIRGEADRGTAVFFSSHILSEVEAACDRVGIMNNGRLVAENTVEGLRELTGASSQLILKVGRVPTELDLTSIEGVSGVSVDDSALRVSFSDPGKKAQVVKRVDAATRITDIKSEQASLEELFDSYTRGEEPTGRKPESPAEVSA
ncbi:ABC transporter ATP-binding protein [Haladaptatus pallidirubidus]|uniref:ABC transporter ATP-binding protein n=1 Tax=Haladaptatus pallidirubidus TaxID=1008152 RepID=UPI0035F05A56